MKRTLLQRVLLALIPVALLSTGSLAFSRLVTPTPMGAPTAIDSVAPVATEEAAPPRFSRSTNDQTLVAQAPQQPQTQTSEQTAAAEEEQHQKTMKEIQEIAEEPMPELVVDKTQLTQAMTELGRAIEQVKLAQTALDGQSQARHLQEAINLLGGFKDPAYSATPLTNNGQSYQGVSPLLIEARVVREAAEVQWIAAVQQRLEARSKRLAEIAQAGNSAAGTVPQPEQPAQPTLDLSQTVGQAGVLGTRGVRPEEQANEMVRRAIRQAGTFANEAASTGSVSDGPDSILRTLEAAMKIIQIAANR
jgi:hypothetical protein